MLITVYLALLALDGLPVVKTALIKNIYWVGNVLEPHLVLL